MNTIDDSAFTRLIEQFGACIGIPALAADERGHCALRFDDRIVGIQQPLESDRMVVYTVIGDMPALDTTTQLRALLRANLFWLGTAGATLSLDENENKLVLAQSWALTEIDLDEFNRQLELFLDTADAWSTRLEAWRHGVSEDLTPPSGARGNIVAG